MVPGWILQVIDLTLLMWQYPRCAVPLMWTVHPSCHTRCNLMLNKKKIGFFPGFLNIRVSRLQSTEHWTHICVLPTHIWEWVKGSRNIPCPVTYCCSAFSSFVLHFPLLPCQLWAPRRFQLNFLFKLDALFNPTPTTGFWSTGTAGGRLN